MSAHRPRPVGRLAGRFVLAVLAALDLDGLPVESVSINFKGMPPLTIPYRPSPCADGDEEGGEGGEGESFVPTPFQLAILDALEGKALRADALGLAVGDRARLYKKPGGVHELREHGLVDHHPRLGYFRPDMPPPELQVHTA